ncbi:MAG TPA: hypothetical protein VGJ06_04705 [Candidatus Acidoferrum sp.]
MTTTPDSGSRTGRREFLVRWNGAVSIALGVVPISAALLSFETKSAALAVPAGLAPDPPQERRGGFPPPPAPADPSGQDKNAPQRIDPQTAKRVMAAKNEKEFREGVEKLYQMATELRDELAQAPKMNVLSVRMYKKTEEIEKLAKQLKSKAKGG